MAVRLPYTFRSNLSADTTATYSQYGQVTRNGTKATIPLKLEINTGSSAVPSAHNRSMVVYNAAATWIDSYTFKVNETWATNTKYTYYTNFTYDLGTTSAATITIFFFIDGTGTAALWSNRAYCADVNIDIPATPTAPSFSQHPTQAVVMEGETAALSCQLTGGLPAVYTYQWQMRTSTSGEFANMAGETSRILNVVSHRSKNNYQFRCKGSNGYFDVYSNAAYVTAKYPPTMQSITGSQTGVVGNSLTFIASHDTGVPVSATTVFQIKKPGSQTWETVQTSTTKSYSFRINSFADHGTLIRVACYNDVNAADSSKWSYSTASTIYVYHKPELVQDLPDTIHVPNGGRFTLSAEATCFYPTEVLAQWEVKDAGADKFVPLGLTGESINVTVDSAWHGRLVRCVFYNAGYPASSLPCVTQECLIVLSSSVGNPTEANLSSTVSGGNVQLTWNDGADGEYNPIVGYQIWYAVKPSGSSEYGEFRVYDLVGIVSSCEIDLTRCNAAFGDTVAFFVQAVGAEGVNESQPPSLDVQIGTREVLFGGVMRIRHNGEWKIAIPYVKHNGIWCNAIPYCKHNGTWKVTG